MSVYNTDMPEVEQIAHAMLLNIANHPGRVGRLRLARLVGGYPVPMRDDEPAWHSVPNDWQLRELTQLVDALISGGLVAQTDGPRPTLCLTRSGFRAFEAMHAAALLPNQTEVSA